MERFDVIIIGGGPGGYVAAIRAAQLKLKTALIEREHLGGICLNWGCIPTKALLHCAEVFSEVQHGQTLGFHVDSVRVDLAQMVRRSRDVATQLNRGVTHLLKKNRVRVIEGHARFVDSQTVSVHAPHHGNYTQAPTSQDPVLGTYSASHIVIATGTRARVLPGIAPDQDRVVTYRDAMTPATLPERLLVIGSGAIGVEFASFYRSLGVQVTLVEACDRILPVEDHEIAQLAHKQFAKRGIRIKTGVTVTAMDKSDAKVLKATFSDGTVLEIDRVISAVGVLGNTQTLALENSGIENASAVTQRGVIPVDAFGRTSQAGVYAIGDVAGGPLLAHKAEHEGVACIEAIAGLAAHPVNRDLIPGCTYSDPQIASIGITELQAKEQNRDVRIGRFPFLGNGKAIAIGKESGLVKTIFDRHSGALLGAHLIGANVTELVQGFVIAISLETTEAELMHTVFPHPTLSETMHESVLDAYGRAIHI